MKWICQNFWQNFCLRRRFKQPLPHVLSFNIRFCLLLVTMAFIIGPHQRQAELSNLYESCKLPFRSLLPFLKLVLIFQSHAPISLPMWIYPEDNFTVSFALNWWAGFISENMKMPRWKCSLKCFHCWERQATRQAQLWTGHGNKEEERIESWNMNWAILTS